MTTNFPIKTQLFMRSYFISTQIYSPQHWLGKHLNMINTYFTQIQETTHEF